MMGSNGLPAAARGLRQLVRAVRTRAQQQAFRQVRARFYAAYWKRTAEAIGAELHELDGAWRQARRGGRWTLIRSDQIALDSALRAGFARNKVLTARLLAPLGFDAPASVSFGLDSLDKALAFQASVGGPVVVKPDGAASGGLMAGDGPGAGRGVTCGLRTPAELERAARWASLFGATLICEEQIDGASYRLLYLDGELIDAVRRDPPRVFGDGLSTIAELIVAENAERRTAGTATALSPLVADLDCRLTLARQGLTLRDVPGAFRAIAVKTVANENASYDNHVARDSIHPELARLGGRLAKHLGLRLAGVDVMTRDPSRFPQERCLFNEVNANPGLHHHWLVAEPQRRSPVGERVLEAALS